MEIDRVLVDIGGSGRQQIKYGMMMCLVKMYHPLHTLQYNIVARKTLLQATLCKLTQCPYCCQDCLLCALFLCMHRAGNPGSSRGITPN